MKWVTLTCLLLCSIVTESRHLQKRDADHHSRHLSGMYLLLGKNNFDNLVLVMLSQDFQKCTLEEHLKMVDEISAIAQHCADHEEDKKCQKSMTTLYYDKVCHIPNLEQGYAWTTECCAKVEPDREKCFHDHRDIEVEPYQRPDADAACTKHKEQHGLAFKSYIYNIARRHPSLYPPAVLALGGQYSTIVSECCEVEDKVACFAPKFAELQKITMFIEYKNKQACHILSTFPERVFPAMKLVKMAQTFPGADFKAVSNLVSESVNLHKDCCKGDVVECMVERMELTQHICDNKKDISSKLEGCCEKSLLERTPCIHALPNDDVPGDLPKMEEFVQDPEVCQKFSKNKEAFLANFLFEFSRRHQELSSQSCLRVGKGYEALLTKCCAAENPAECYSVAPQLFETGIKNAKVLAEKNCELYQKMGDTGYMTELLHRYVQKMPQVSDPTMIEMTGKMTKIAGKCCALPENQLMSCGEEKLDLLLGDMCERQKHTFINDQVRHCCTDSYADRRPCFTNLGVDPSYKPAAFDESSFQVDANICDGSEAEQLIKRLPFLIHILKLKPDMSGEKMRECIEKFTVVRMKCCAEEDRQTCFDDNKAAVLTHVKGELK